MSLIDESWTIMVHVKYYLKVSYYYFYLIEVNILLIACDTMSYWYKIIVLLVTAAVKVKIY